MVEFLMAAVSESVGLLADDDGDGDDDDDGGGGGGGGGTSVAVSVLPLEPAHRGLLILNMPRLATPACWLPQGRGGLTHLGRGYPIRF